MHSNRVVERTLSKILLVIALILLLTTLNYLGESLSTKYRSGVEETYRDLLKSSSSSSGSASCQDIDLYGDKCYVAQHYCASEGLFNYTAWHYCLFESAWLSVVILIACLALAFFMLGTSTEDYFCPTLTLISKHLKMSPSLAGVTLLALGNGSPDVFSTIAGIHRGSFAIAMGELLGAGVFVTSIVVGAVAIAATAQQQKGSLLRDVGFYIIALVIVFAITHDGKIYIWEGIGFIAYYALYAITTLGMQLYATKRRKAAAAAEVIVTSPIQTGKESLSNNKPELIVRGFSVNDEEEPPLLPPRILSASERQPLLGSPEPPSPAPELRRVYFGRVGMYVTDMEKEGEAYTVHKCVTDEHHTNPDLSRHHHHTGKEIKAISLDVRVRKSFFAVIGERIRKRSKWDKRSLFAKILYIITLPAHLAFAITIPSVRTKHWNKLWALLWPLCIPPIIFLAFEIDINTEVKVDDKHTVYLWIIVEGVGLLLSIIMFFTTNYYTPPKYKPIFIPIAFVMSILWIYLIANEVVSILMVLGEIFNISQAILGMTVMAWGNSVSDLAADLVVARKGYPEMALSACFGGPLFNLLMGLGIACTVACIPIYPHPYIVALSPKLLTAAAFLAASLLSTIMFVPHNKYIISRKYGIYLIAFYICFMVTSVVLEALKIA